MKQHNTKKMHTKKSCNGFTLIEMALVILIIGFLVIPLLQLHKIYTINKEIEETKKNIDSATTAIALLPTYYPCPSDRSLPPSDPNYGIEQCTGMPVCNGLGNQGICRTLSLRDADGTGGNDPVLIGGVPSRDNTGAAIIGMRLSYAFDGWGNKLTYAVSETLTNHAPPSTNKNFKLGVVSAINEFRNNTAGVNDDAQFAIISHGKDSSGAFTLEGAFNPCPVGTRESENCDGDSVFVQGLGAYEGAGAGYYDDLSYFYLKSSDDLWHQIVNTATSTTMPHLNNLNDNNVGVNVASPLFKLDVGGTIDAGSIRSDQICDATGANCISPTIFSAIPTTAGPNFCQNGQIATKIGTSTITCDYPTIDAGAGTKTATCPGTSFISAILTNGCIKCNDGSQRCP